MRQSDAMNTYQTTQNGGNTHTLSYNESEGYKDNGETSLDSFQMGSGRTGSSQKCHDFP